MVGNLIPHILYAPCVQSASYGYTMYYVEAITFLLQSQYCWYYRQYLEMKLDLIVTTLAGQGVPRP